MALDPHLRDTGGLAVGERPWEANGLPAPSVTLPASRRYHSLLELGEKRKAMLEKSCKRFMLFREANELQQWINEKEAALTSEEVGADLEQVEVLQKKFDDFQKVRAVWPLTSSPRAWWSGLLTEIHGNPQGSGGAGPLGSVVTGT